MIKRRGHWHIQQHIQPLGLAMELHAGVLYEQQFEEAKSEALHAGDFYEKLRAVKDAEDRRDL